MTQSIKARSANRLLRSQQEVDVDTYRTTVLVEFRCNILKKEQGITIERILDGDKDVTHLVDYLNMTGLRRKVWEEVRKGHIELIKQDMQIETAAEYDRRRQKERWRST